MVREGLSGHRNEVKLEKLLDRRGSITMPPPGFQICLLLRVTLNFNLLTHKLIVSYPCRILLCVLICIKIGSLVFAISCSKVRQRTDWRTDERTDGQIENVVPSVSAAYRTHKTLLAICDREIGISRSSCRCLHESSVSLR